MKRLLLLLALSSTAFGQTQTAANPNVWNPPDQQDRLELQRLRDVVNDIAAVQLPEMVKKLQAEIEQMPDYKLIEAKNKEKEAAQASVKQKAEALIEKYKMGDSLKFDEATGSIVYKAKAKAEPKKQETK